MTPDRKIPGTIEAWENRELGADADFIEVAEDVDQSTIDEALELQAISIRLQKSLIEDFKMIAKLNGIGYQPLMRQALTRFADGEKKRIIRELVAKSETQRREEQLQAELLDKQELRSGTHG